MFCDRHNLLCALLGFALVGLVGFALSGGLSDLEHNRPDPAVHDSTQQ